MALDKFIKTNYSVVETNHVAAVRTGKIKGQYSMSNALALVGAQNGQLLTVDDAKKEIGLPANANAYVWLHVSEERLQQSHLGRNKFILTSPNYPRMLKLAVGDIFETDAVVATLEEAYEQDPILLPPEIPEGATPVPAANLTANDITINGVTLTPAEGAVAISFDETVTWPASQSLDAGLGLEENWIYIDVLVAPPATATKVKVGEDLVDVTVDGGVIVHIPVGWWEDTTGMNFVEERAWTFVYEWFDASDDAVSVEHVTITREAVNLEPRMVTWEDVQNLAAVGVPHTSGNIELKKAATNSEKVILNVVEWVALPHGGQGVKFKVAKA